METQSMLTNVNTASCPSELKITDMRIVRTQVGGPILKLDTKSRDPRSWGGT